MTKKKMTQEEKQNHVRERHKRNQRKLAKKRQLDKARSFVKEIIYLHEYGISASQIAETILANNIRLTGYKEETFDNGIHVEII